MFKYSDHIIFAWMNANIHFTFSESSYVYAFEVTILSGKRITGTYTNNTWHQFYIKGCINKCNYIYLQQRNTNNIHYATQSQPY